MQETRVASPLPGQARSAACSWVAARWDGAACFPQLPGPYRGVAAQFTMMWCFWSDRGEGEWKEEARHCCLLCPCRRWYPGRRVCRREGSGARRREGAHYRFAFLFARGKKKRGGRRGSDNGQFHRDWVGLDGV
jgi:hypothetical protein